MAIFIKTRIKSNRFNPMVVEAIGNHDIVTWSIDKDGDYTIERSQWKYRSWFRAYIIDEDTIAYGIIQSMKFQMTNQLYGVYHGRFVATLLTHFSDQIKDISVTPDPISEIDIIE